MIVNVCYLKLQLRRKLIYILYKCIKAHLLSEWKHWGERAYASFVSLAYTCSPGTLVPKLADSQLVGLSQWAGKRFSTWNQTSRQKQNTNLCTIHRTEKWKNTWTNVSKNTEKLRKIFSSSFECFDESLNKSDKCWNILDLYWGYDAYMHPTDSWWFLSGSTNSAIWVKALASTLPVSSGLGLDPGSGTGVWTEPGLELLPLLSLLLPVIKIS